MNNNATDRKTQELVLTGLMACAVFVATCFIKVPVLNGYVHPGDALIYISAIMLGKKYGAAAGGIGGALADIMGGYAVWAPWTFVIKALMGFTAGLIIEKFAARKMETGNRFVITAADGIAMVAGSVINCGGYFLGNSVMYGGIAAGIAAMPGDIIQDAMGIGFGLVLEVALVKTPLGRKSLA